MNTEDLIKMAQRFRDENPRYLDFSLDIIHYAVFSQTGIRLPPEDFKDFCLFLTGYDLTLESIKRALDTMPEWLRKMYERNSTTSINQK